MSKVNTGLLKDILWYLKGAIETKGIYEIKDSHIASLHIAIEKLEEKDKLDVEKVRNLISGFTGFDSVKDRLAQAICDNEDKLR